MSRCFLTPRSLITYTSSSANSSRNSAFSINRSIMPLFKYHSKSGPLCSAIRIRRISGLIRRMTSHSSMPFMVGSVYSAITSSYASGFFWIRSISAAGCAYRSTVFGCNAAELSRSLRTLHGRQWQSFVHALAVFGRPFLSQVGSAGSPG